MKRNNIKKLFLKLSVCCLTLVFVIAVIWITEPETYGSSKIDGKQFALEMANLINNMNENEENKNVVGEISGITITELESTALRYKLEGSANPYEDALNHIKELKSEELVAEQNRITVTMDEAIEYTQWQKELMYSDTESDILEFMDEYIKALGLTEDEYWNDYKVKENQRYLLHLKVKSYLSEHPEDVIDVSKLQVKLQSSKYSKRRCIAEYINNKNAFQDESLYIKYTEGR